VDVTTTSVQLRLTAAWPGVSSICGERTKFSKIF